MYPFSRSYFYIYFYFLGICCLCFLAPFLFFPFVSLSALPKHTLSLFPLPSTLQKMRLGGIAQQNRIHRTTKGDDTNHSSNNNHGSSNDRPHLDHNTSMLRREVGEKLGGVG